MQANDRTIEQLHRARDLSVRVGQAVLDVGATLAQIAVALIKALADLITGELREIHQRRNLFRTSVTTLFTNAIGLGVGLWSASLVGSYYETRKAANLWGFYTQKTIITEDQLIMIEFGVKFVVILIVFTIITHYLEELKAWSSSRK
jgi:hypothetical protein